MTLEPMLTDPLVIATLITIIAGFVLLFAFSAFDKFKLQRRIKQLEKNNLDVVVAFDLYEKRLIEHGIKIKEIFGDLSFMRTEINNLQHDVKDLQKDK